jgi:hypothetical protein
LEGSKAKRLQLKWETIGLYISLGVLVPEAADRKARLLLYWQSSSVGISSPLRLEARIYSFDHDIHGKNAIFIQPFHPKNLNGL